MPGACTPQTEYNMKRYILTLLSLVAMGAMAQSKFGYVSYMELVKALPEYSIVVTHLDELQAKYEAEQRAKDEAEQQQKAEATEYQE